MRNAVRKTTSTFLLIILVISCDFRKENPNEILQTSSQDVSVVNGLISEEPNGNPLSGVNITVNGILKQSDANGVFEFGNTLSPGNYKLSANKAGYVGITRDIEIIKDISSFISLRLFKKSESFSINAATGGTIGLNTGKILQIPANALSQNTDISVTQVLGSGIPVQMNDRFIVEALSLEPNGLVFKSPATIQVPINISGVNKNEVKAVSISASGNEEISEINISNNSLTIPINHFSYIYFYLPLQTMRYRKVAFSDSLKPTSAIADCRSNKAVYEVTLSSKVINSSLTENILTAQIGRDIRSEIKRTLIITRKTNEQKKQLYYQISGSKYIFEILNGNIWNEIALVEVQEKVKTIAKDVGICHDQGIGN